MKFYLLITFLFFLQISQMPAQTVYEKGDTVELRLNGYKSGNIKWQYSTDKENWTDIAYHSDTIKRVLIDKSCYYRAEVSECRYLYFSDTTQIESPNSDYEYADFVGKYLASDEYGGRYPGTKGDSMSVNFIADLFKHSNLRPLNSISFLKSFTSLNNIPTFNVIGVLPGSDPKLSKEVIVISGHYDHLGTVNRLVFNGADDNASGVVGVCMLARKFKDAQLKRTLLFISPGLEEKGQQGTVIFIKSKEVPIENIKYVFNFDMIGRLRSDSVFFCSTSYSPDVALKIKDCNSDNLNIKFLNSGLFPGSTSDNGIYTANKGTNNLSAFGITTGKEPEYHTYKDDWNLINISGLVKITNLLYRIIESLANE